MKRSPSKEGKPKRRTLAKNGPQRLPQSFSIVGIGASAGGLEAFSELLHNLPEQTGMAFVLVQHLDPSHESALPEILGRTTKLPVKEVTEGTVVQPDHVYVIPANAGMAILNGKLQLKTRDKHGQHMPIDSFFRSLAEEIGQRAIGVILSGTASDGTEGCQAIKKAAGITFAQNEQSAKYDSMPSSAIHAGCIDFILTPKEIARELAGISKHPYVTRALPARKEEYSGMMGSELEVLFSLLRESTGVDFTNYKHTTLQRRIRRRMDLHRMEKLKEYLQFIAKQPAEIDELYRDLLINVTGFFREPEAFTALRKLVYPKLFEGRHADSPVRVWVAGCSTGEEAYSIAITLLEYLWAHTRNITQAATAIQIFATDISETCLERARSGTYPKASVANISPERLKRFFVHTDGGFQVNKSIRDMCIFARQNLVKDPPFSNLDLVSCRNLLIYLGPVLQRRVIPTLHYALKPDGYLMLGDAESLAGFGDHFSLVDKKDKIYQKRKTTARLATYFASTDYSPRRLEDAKTGLHFPAPFTVENEVEQLLINRFVPASVVVNDRLEIVQFQGRTGAYLELAAGQPSFSLTRMAREGLVVDLRAALSVAKKTNAPMRKERVPFQSEGKPAEVDLEVIPLRAQGAQERYYVIVFQEPPTAPTFAKNGAARPTSTSHSANIQGLRREIVQLRGQLSSLIEDHETTLEEFKSVNEEVLSANEELQSTNEELETAKEELQSTNEELMTLNDEMQNRNAELGSVNSDLVNLLDTVNLPVVMVSVDLRIRRFTPPCHKLLNLLPSDIGRRLGEIRTNLELQDLETLVQETVHHGATQNLEVCEKNGAWYALRIRPYKSWDSKVTGAVISLQDIDSLKRRLEKTREYAGGLIENSQACILLLDDSLRVTAANRAFYQTFNANAAETEGRPVYELAQGDWNAPRLRALLQQIVTDHTEVNDFELSHDFQNLGLRTMRLNASRVELQSGHPSVVLSIEDVTAALQTGVA
jgi:two-component system, chemotaxis family, CheB/CheR fusion protein